MRQAHRVGMQNAPARLAADHRLICCIIEGGEHRGNFGIYSSPYPPAPAPAVVQAPASPRVALTIAAIPIRRDRDERRVPALYDYNKRS